MHKHKFTIVLLSPLPVKIRILLITRLVARRKVHIWLHVSKQVATQLPCQSRLIIGHPGHLGRHLGHRGHHTLGPPGQKGPAQGKCAQDPATHLYNNQLTPGSRSLCPPLSVWRKERSSQDRGGRASWWILSTSARPWARLHARL